MAVGTKIYAPANGEMFKTEYNQYKGNVGIYIFTHEGVEWGLELCHLNQQPPKGVFTEGAVIAHSGNTGSATTGAHLHAVLHRDAMVTRNYSELTSRDAFLSLTSQGKIVDCYEWFNNNVTNTSPTEPVPTPTPTPVTSTPTPQPVTPTPVKKKSSLLKRFFKFLAQIFKK